VRRLRDTTTGAASPGRRRPDADPVAVRIGEIHLAHPVFGLVDRRAELSRDRVEIVHIEVEEPVRFRVALVLGDSTERELRKALISGGGSPLFFFSSWLSTATLLLALVLVLIPLVRTLLARRRGATVAAAAGHAAR